MPGLAPQPLILASKSEARRKMLAAAGIPHEARPSNVDERAVEAKVNPQSARAAAALLAREKALSVSRDTPGRLVLGADQTLSLGSERLSKPPGRDEAAAQLRMLSGKTHELTSACALALDGRIVFGAEDTARLTARKFGDAFIARYLDAAGDAVTRSVGGYQLEGLGIHLFERIDGDHFTILGLPMLPLLAYLRGAGYVAE